MKAGRKCLLVVARPNGRVQEDRRVPYYSFHQRLPLQPLALVLMCRLWQEKVLCNLNIIADHQVASLLLQLFYSLSTFT